MVVFGPTDTPFNVSAPDLGSWSMITALSGSGASVESVKWKSVAAKLCGLLTFATAVESTAIRSEERRVVNVIGAAAAPDEVPIQADSVARPQYTWMEM